MYPLFLLLFHSSNFSNINPVSVMASNALTSTYRSNPITDFIILDSKTIKSTRTSFKNISITSLNADTLNYLLFDIWDEYADPQMNGFLFISGGPWKVFGMIFGYLITIKLLMHYMKNRDPYDCRQAMIYYNLFNMVSNLFGFVIGMLGTNMSIDVWGCKKKYFPTYLMYFGYGYMILKFIDFVDTILFVLRKKNNQVSFLHVSHHCLMPMTCYFAMKYVPYGNTGFVPLINSLVHVIMYFYYYLSSLGPQYYKYLWWKKYITLIQLAQFAIKLVHAMQVYYVPNCDYPKAFANLEIAQSIFFIFTFSNFYFKTYWKNDKKVE